MRYEQERTVLPFGLIDAASQRIALRLAPLLLNASAVPSMTAENEGVRKLLLSRATEFRRER
jgi:hypothetical protein